jgi:hypothetical protein
MFIAYMFLYGSYLQKSIIQPTKSIAYVQNPFIKSSIKGCCQSQYNNTTINIQKLLMEHSNHISFQNSQLRTNVYRMTIQISYGLQNGRNK